MIGLPKLTIAGAAGRMGRALTRAAAELGYPLAGATEHAGHADIGADAGRLAGLDPMGAPLTADPAAAAAGADVFIDFTTPAACLSAIAALQATPVRALIIGATGFSPAEEAGVAAASTRFAIVKSGNFSLGVTLLAALVEQAAARLGPDWDIEIIEAHHRRKVDAPSGTALLLGEAAAKGRGAGLDALRLSPRDGFTGARPAGGIGFAVVRGGGIVGDHDVLFASETEVIRLAHHAADRAVFAHGALKAAAWAAGKPPGLYSMRDVLGL